MTDHNRFKLAVAGLILALITFSLFTYMPQLAHSAPADFLQGFSGGVALGCFFAVLHYGRLLRRARA